MSGFTTQQSEIRTRFNSIWANRTPVDFPNKKFTQPSPPAPWCRFRVTNGDSVRTTIGASTNNYRHLGIIYVQVFIPDDSDVNVGYALAETAADTFRDWGGATVQCRTPNIKEIGSDGSGYFQINVSIPFRRDELL